MIESFHKDVLEFSSGQFERWPNLALNGNIYAACRWLVSQEPKTAACERYANLIEQCFHALGSPGARSSLGTFLGHQGASWSTDRILARTRALLASALAAQNIPGHWADHTASLLKVPDTAARFWIDFWSVSASGGKPFRSGLTAAYGNGRVVPISLNVWSLGVVGTLIEHPEIALHPLSDDLLAAVKMAWEVSGVPGVAWSLKPWRVRFADLPPLGGDSLGLSAAMQMMALAKGRDLDPHWIAMGALHHGGIRAVGEERAKLIEMQRASLVSGATDQGLAPVHGAVVAEEGSEFLSESTRSGMATMERPIRVHLVRNVQDAFERMVLRPRLIIAQERYERSGPLIRVSLVERLLQQVRERQHLSLHGPPLCGRRRIAVAVASEIQRRDGWRAALIPLKAMHPEPLHAQLLRALNAPENEKADALDSLLDVLNEHPTVLVLDDLEDLLPTDRRTAAHEVFDELLSRAERLACLFVSRHSITMLPVTTEWIGPLATEGSADTVQSLRAVDSVRLFVERAQRRNASFLPGLDDLRQIQELCRALDGLPGLIQIYSEMYPAVSPSEAATAIRDLRGNNPGNGGHQGTINSALESTYRSLKAMNSDAAVIYPRLSVFPHSWSRAAARTVCADSRITPERVDAALNYLCQRHLVQRVSNPDGGENRYSFRSVICSDARSRLSGPARKRHADLLRKYLVKLTQEYDGQSVGTDKERSAWNRVIGAERHNIDALINEVLRSRPSNDGQIEKEAASLALAIWRVYEELGLYREGQEMLQKLIERPSISKTTRAWLGAGAGWLAYRRGILEDAEALLREAKKLFDDAGDTSEEDGKEGSAMVSSDLGVVEMRRGRWKDAIRLIESGLELYSTLFQQRAALQRFIRGQAFSNNNLGRCYRLSGNHDMARQHLENAQRLFQNMGRASEALFAKVELGYLALEQGDATALDLATAAQRDARYYGQKLLEARASTLLGHVVWRQRHNADEAMRYYHEGLQGFLGLGASSGMAEALEALACLAWDTQDRARAGTLLGAADDWRATSGEIRPKLGEDFCQTVLAAAKDRALGDALADGRGMGLTQAAQYALRREPDEDPT